MYWLLLLALLGLGVWILLPRPASGWSRPRVAAGLGVVAATLLFFAWLSFLGELLWFEAAGYSDVQGAVPGDGLGHLGAGSELGQ